MSFTHLHLHTQYSLLDGACRIGELVSYAKSMGQTSLAITDHGVMYGVIDFYRECKKQGIHPVIGCEVYVAPRSRFDKIYELDKEYYHMVLLCENDQGYRNLVKLVSLGYTEGFYSKPRIDDELLEKYHEGLICLSACLSGEIPKALLRGDYRSALEKARYYQSVFGKENFFIEIQDHGIEEQKRILPDLVKLGRETGAPLVATNDCHYIRKEDSEMHSVLLCIQTNHTLSDQDKAGFPTEEFYLKSEDEMRALFREYPEAIENTQKIADRCHVEIEFGVRKLPDFKTPNNENHYDFFRRKCYDGLTQKYGESPDKEIIDRLEYELSVICKMGFVDYFLIVADFIAYAKSKDIPVGPGRGSGAGSLCAYSIGITGIDPIRYNLLFERFLNPERVSMPDFDVDFCTERRGEVIDYVTRKYTPEHVAQIAAFGTFQPKAAVRDVGRVLDIPYASVDKVAKLIPFTLGITIDKALELSADLKKLYSTDETVRRLIDLAKKIEGMPRHITVHAAGVVITDRGVSDYVPLTKCDDAVLTQYTMTTLEELGLLKMDFLGLRNLTVIHDAEKLIRKREPGFSIENISLDDKATYDMISSGETEGVFQMESNGMKNVLVQVKPRELEDIIAVISLYRPGPMDSIPQYINNRSHPEQIRYEHPLLEPILSVTNGCIVYQEQVMQIARSLAGYSLGRADILRRAMSKKKHAVMEKEREIFIHGLVRDDGTVEVDGCLRRGVDEATAKSIFSQMETFASYAFNKSHAAAYSAVTYRTAYLKCHYKREYMAALLSSVIDNQNKTASYIGECKRMNIAVLPPSVNESESRFTVSSGNIRFGLSAVKNLGVHFISEILSERQRGNYISLYDFAKRLNGRGLNQKSLEALIKCGALDHLGSTRRTMLSAIPALLSDLEYQRKKGAAGQISLFDMGADNAAEPPFMTREMQEFDLMELLSQEKEMTGMYLSGHPIDSYRPYADRIRADFIGKIVDENTSYQDRQSVRLICSVTNNKSQLTKSNKMMAFVSIEDRTGSMEMIVFPDVLSQCHSALYVGAVLRIEGTLSFKEEEEPKLIANTVFLLPPAEELTIEKSPDESVSVKKPVNEIVPGKEQKLYLRLPDLECEKYRKAKNLLEIFHGNTRVIFYLTDTKKQVLGPVSLWAKLNNTLVDELCYQLGEENVVLK